MNDAAELAEELSELFREHVSVDSVTQRELAGATISVATMSYSTSGSGDSSNRHYQQTAVVLDDQQLDVPEFSLRPRVTGLLGKLLKVMGNVAAIEFTDSPKFSENYYLHGWVVEPVRILFTKAIRDHLAQHPGWSVRGKKHRLVIFQSDRVCKDDEVDDFVRESLDILALFQEGEEALDERPEIRREVRPEDISLAATQVGGLAGKLLQNQLNKISVTRNEFSAFVASPPPREVPPGMFRQVVGDNLPLIFVGILFFIGGIIGGTLWIILAEGVLKLLGIPLLLIFTIAGFLMAFLTLRHRKRKTRTLREGVLASGLVTNVRKSDVTVNSQVRFHVTLKYQHEGQEHTTVANAYGSAVDQAQALKDSGQETTVLVDPEDASHVICLDMLIIFD